MQPTPEEDAVNSAESTAATPADPDRVLRKRHGNGPLFFVIGTIFAIATSIGWGYSVMSYSGLSGSVYHQVVSYDAGTADEASITFEVNSRDGAECLITALDDQHVEVGQERLEVEAGNRMATTTVDTIRQASTVEIASCREQGSQD
ncbi:DUF4307 domain-containing protein [Nocardiopsis sp. HNM0947]|uniref:DUF4307 domain-containing protein n=1 Tax=Nocardiopsis coralli TaxID=2772213 RepID=A0ABR9P8Q5_9ACTN|nr:DUF4307 domain-containing protein [Nocardiopsis coralli]MBE3000225.1 DUF4307 domain-containing protein [Nocardiopsis coralli]